jgi:hypothetical protein
MAAPERIGQLRNAILTRQNSDRDADMGSPETRQSFIPATEGPSDLQAENAFLKDMGTPAPPSLTPVHRLNIELSRYTEQLPLSDTPIVRF